MQAITVKVENAYSDGHESTHEVVLQAPDGLEWDHGALARWFDEDVWPHIGDGHGADNDLGSCLTATIIAADEAELLGISKEWTD